jgi:hypothetical protein
MLPASRDSSAHDVEASAAGTESTIPDSAEQSELRPTAVRPFTWLERDAADAAQIAFMLGMFRAVEAGEGLMETSRELSATRDGFEGRRPRLTDAWRFFHAANLLRKTSQSTLSARAQQLGARIALHITGWMVVDMCLAECGASAGIGLYVEGHEDTPLVTPILAADGTTAIDRAKATGAA